MYNIYHLYARQGLQLFSRIHNPNGQWHLSIPAGRKGESGGRMMKGRNNDLTWGRKVDAGNERR